MDPSDNIPLQPRGQRNNSVEYSNDVVSSQNRYDYPNQPPPRPPPYVNTLITKQRGPAPLPVAHDYLDLGSRGPNAEATPRQNAPAQRSTRCCLCVIAVLFFVIGVGVGGAMLYMLNDKIIPSRDFNEFLTNPCQNQGSYVEGTDGYTCECVDGYMGIHCEQISDANGCSNTACLNGGQCVDDANGYECQCLPGWTGQMCEADINECVSQPCQNGGICVEFFDGYICQCTAGYHGLHCEQNINECAVNSCQNQGSCVDGTNGYMCKCVAGYIGVHCEHSINECASGPCFNGGTCVDAINGYTCRCMTGYEGVHCEQNINECASSPCLNGGQCVDGVNEYECQCLPGWTGRICQSAINECLSGPCRNGGSCVDVIDGYVCRCTAGYKGVNCELDYCPQYWFFFHNECYRYFSILKSWTDANTYCKNNGAELVSIHSYAENRFISGLSGTASVWIGLNDRATEGRFIWTDYTPLDYTNWKSGEPNNKDNEDCIGSWDSEYFSKWNDFSCGDGLGFVCKKK